MVYSAVAVTTSSGAGGGAGGGGVYTVYIVHAATGRVRGLAAAKRRGSVYKRALVCGVGDCGALVGGRVAADTNAPPGAVCSPYTFRFAYTLVGLPIPYTYIYIYNILCMYIYIGVYTHYTHIYA